MLFLFLCKCNKFFFVFFSGSLLLLIMLSNTKCLQLLVPICRDMFPPFILFPTPLLYPPSLLSHLSNLYIE